MTRRLTWIAPWGDEWVFDGDRGPTPLVNLDGHDGAPFDPVVRRSPGQVGGSAVNIDLPPRVVVASIGLIGRDQAGLGELRRALYRSLAVSPVGIAQSLDLGTLRLTQPGMIDLEIPAIPRTGPISKGPDPTHTLEEFDLEFLCPDPRWRGPEDVEVSFEPGPGGGFTFPLELPFSSDNANTVGAVENIGDVAAPIVARFYGEFTDGVLTLEETGETITILDTVDAGDFIEVSTAYGDKYVRLHSGGTVTDVLGRLEIATSTFFQLPPGESTVAFEAASNPSGSVTVTYRPLYSGA